MQKIFTKLNEALASAKALLHASRHVAESDSVALQQHRICASLESSVKERGKVYFADSYCSWQKGAIENANKFIRKYIPKKANFDDFSDRRIMEILEDYSYHCTWYSFIPHESFTGHGENLIIYTGNSGLVIDTASGRVFVDRGTAEHTYRMNYLGQNDSAKLTAQIKKVLKI